MFSLAAGQMKMLVPSWDAITCSRVLNWLDDTCNIQNGHTAYLSRHPYIGVLDGIYSLSEANQFIESTRMITRAEQILGVASVLLHEAAQSGHTYIACAEMLKGIQANMPRPGIGESPATLLQIESVLDLHPKKVRQDQLGRHFLPQNMVAEEVVGTWIRRATSGNRPLGTELNPLDYATAPGSDAFPYTPAQYQAVASIISSQKSRLHILTGGPGTGKTAVMRLLAAVCRRQAVRIAFAAPTGMAAKVLSSRLQDLRMTATTVHVLLEGSTTEFFKCEANPLDVDLLVVDEAGMLDIQLLANVVRALPVHAHLLLVGDEDQVQSVGPGQVLSDCKEIEGANLHMLQGSHRSQGAIHQIVEGVCRGVFSVPSSNNVSLNEKFDQAIFESQFLSAWEQYGAPNVSVLLPTKGLRASTPYRGVAGFNLALQALVNKDGIPIEAGDIRVGDRIIVRANLNAEVTTPGGGTGMAYVANGDRGVIVSTDLSGDVLLRLDAAPHQLCRIPRAIARKHIELGYASTIHLAQGSEYACVFLVIQDYPSDFLNRSVLLTGLSRARDALAIYGDGHQLQRIARRHAPPRRTALKEQVFQRISHV